MQSYIMEVSKKENGAYVKQGEVTVFYPLLSELGLAVEPTGKDEDGFPTYADDRTQYAFDAVLAAVKAAARNKLQSGTALLKDGNKIAETVEELLAGGDRDGSALKARREFFAAFKAYLPSLGKPAGWVQGVYDIASNVKNIQYQSDKRKEILKGIMEGFAESLTADQIGAWERTLTQIYEACAAANPLDD